MAFRRIAGFAGLSFVALVGLANIVIGSLGRLEADASVNDIAAYFADHGETFKLISAIAPLIWVVLPLFAIGVLFATRSDTGVMSPWAIAGVAAVATQNAVFSGVIATETILAVRVDALADEAQFTRMLWDLHTAAFSLNTASLALALGGFSLAVLTSGSAGRWLGRVGLLGAALLLGGSATASSAMDGSVIALIGLPGFLIWLVFIATFSVRLLRTAEIPETA